MLHVFFIELAWLLHPFLSVAHQHEHKERHFLHYTFTALTRADSFPEFSAEVVYDDRRISHYSDEERVWIRTEGWTEAPADPPDHRDWFTHQIRTLSDCTDSQCSELHVLQRIIGCELEKLPDGSVNLTVFDEYRFDGEDLISFNSDTAQWIDKSPKAKETKVHWDRQKGRNQFIKHFLKTCTDWISTFNNTNMNRACSDREAESPWLCVAGIAAVVLAGLGLLCRICLQVQKVHSENAVETLTSDPNPDTKPADIRLFIYESGSTLLSGI